MYIIINKILGKNMSIFEVNKEKFIEIFKKENSFEIPEYQRPFSWEEKQLNDLLDDLSNALNRNYPEYLLGTVYLQRVNDDTFKILDGQQRFISMYLLLKSLNYECLPKLEIGKNDNDFFQKLIKRNEIEFPLSPSSASQKRLKIALELFKNKVEAFEETKILEFINKNLSIIVTVVNDPKVAITTFITQTDRGKRLTNLEKLKSILYYYKLQLNEENENFNNIENLFGEIYQSLNKLYNKPETSEADILRVLMIRLEQDDSYRKDLAFKKLNENNIERIASWEAGEDEIFSWIQRVLSSFNGKKEILEKALERIINILEQIEKSLKYYVDNFNTNLKNVLLSLNPSRFSRAYLVDYLCKESINSFEIDKEFIEQVNIDIQEISEINRPNLNKENFPNELYNYIEKVEERIKGYKNNLKNKNILTFIERAELSCWKVSKRPLGKFLNYPIEKAEEHLINFANEHKKSYFLRDFGYGNYRYILMAYESYHNNQFQIENFYSVMSENNEITKVHREHIFAQNPEKEIWEEIKEHGFGENKTNYNNWIWNIGNIALLSEKDNISESNKTPWNKAVGYIKQLNFITTQMLGKDILQYCKKKDKEQVDLNLLKSLLDIREYELKMFAWYRF